MKPGNILAKMASVGEFIWQKVNDNGLQIMTYSALLVLLINSIFAECL
ncbi:hypothetical protein [Campylobacter suis]|uniref:Uncharacterized protein n=1 Tax=Campylobacter suis TaxID=2790657 RepID=A0ABN7K1A6_9BACT|nr:hypothetical protein [Campylobacter suis]CAD7286322.1 hypothetical protein LMG8286_00153 [Campylobacter suis]